MIKLLVKLFIIKLYAQNIFRGYLLERRGWPFQGDCSFYTKNKLKSEKFDDKKGRKKKMLSSVLTKNVNSGILIKNLVTFKR